jgi:hypothetical protein
LQSMRRGDGVREWIFDPHSWAGANARPDPLGGWARVSRPDRAQRGAVLTWVLLAVLAGVIVIIVLTLIVSAQPATIPNRM